LTRIFCAVSQPAGSPARKATTAAIYAGRPSRPNALIASRPARNCSRRLKRAPVLAVLVLLIAGSLILSVLVTNASAPWAYFGMHTRAWELAIGALAAVAVKSFDRLPRRLAIVAGIIGSLTTDECVEDQRTAVLKPVRRQLIAEAARDEGAVVIDPTPWLCAQGRCPVIVGTTVVYRDGSHMSATYAALLTSLLAEKLPVVR
jgi:hypothetical protein